MYRGVTGTSLILKPPEGQEVRYHRLPYSTVSLFSLMKPSTQLSQPNRWYWTINRSCRYRTLEYRAEIDHQLNYSNLGRSRQIDCCCGKDGRREECILQSGRIKDGPSLFLRIQGTVEYRTPIYRTLLSSRLTLKRPVLSWRSLGTRMYRLIQSDLWSPEIRSILRVMHSSEPARIPYLPPRLSIAILP